MIVFKTSKPMRAKNIADLHRQVERRVIVDVIKAKGGNIAEAAAVIGIGREGLYKMLKRHGMWVSSGKVRPG